MAIHGFPGGVISATAPTTSPSGASGVWTLDDQLQAGANWPVAPALATNSVRLRSSATAYMTRTPAVASNRKTWTWSGWVKRGSLTAQSPLFSSFAGSQPSCNIIFSSSGGLWVYNYTSSYDFDLFTTQVFRDPAAWYHIVVACDTTQATSTNRLKLYVNGQQITSFTNNPDNGGATTYPTLNFNTDFNTASAHEIGSQGSFAYFDGYLTEINFIDGQALTPNYFGATSVATGTWQPATYRGTYGTNGFYLPMNVQGYTAEYLAVAGGGGTAYGGTGGGGGGAGGYVEGNVPFASGTTYAVTVGAGGTGGTNGSDSVLSFVTAKGGGFTTSNGQNGGSGGGGGNTNGATNFGVSIQTSPSGGTGYGNSGAGKPSGGGYAGGGGGGAGSAGNPSTGSSTGGAGGSGRSSSITGSSVTYAGGGGGWGLSSGASGGSGGGGNGDSGDPGGGGTDGSANTGGGGGGANNFSHNGGSGVVILKILTSNYTGITTGSPTVTTDGSYTVVKYTDSGSYTA